MPLDVCKNGCILGTCTMVIIKMTNSCSYEFYDAAVSYKTVLMKYLETSRDYK